MEREKILQCSHQLADLIKNSPEFIAYKKARDILEQNESSMELLLDFRALQMKLQLSHWEQGENAALEKQLDDMYFTLSMHEDINHFLNAEYCFSKMLHQIQKIFATDLGMKQEQVNLLQVN